MAIKYPFLTGHNLLLFISYYLNDTLSSLQTFTKLAVHLREKTPRRQKKAPLNKAIPCISGNSLHTWCRCNCNHSAVSPLTEVGFIAGKQRIFRATHTAWPVSNGPGANRMAASTESSLTWISESTNLRLLPRGTVDGVLPALKLKTGEAFKVNLVCRYTAYWKKSVFWKNNQILLDFQKLGLFKTFALIKMQLHQQPASSGKIALITHNNELIKM